MKGVLNFTEPNVSLTKEEDDFIALWKIIIPPFVADGKSPLPNLFFKCFFLTLELNSWRRLVRFILK